MKLLLDQNLSRNLVRDLTPLFPDSRHVLDLELDTATDREILNYAGANDFTIMFEGFRFSPWPLPNPSIWPITRQRSGVNEAGCHSPLHQYTTPLVGMVSDSI